MKFNYKECTAQDVANIKKLYKQQSNNPKITKKYTDILEDTKTAIKNLNSCITSQEKLRTIMKLIQQENTSFMKNIIGVNERGNNNSYYRGFLSLDEKNVLEIRIANHYETENSAKDKSNNVSQFLFQVVLKTTPPKNQTTDSITKNKKVANLNIITKTLKTNSTIEEVCSLLKCISDFLISPSDDYANNEQTTIKDTNSINNKQINCNINMKTNKKTIKLTESDLHRVIKESVKKVLKENLDEDNFVIVNAWNSRNYQTYNELYFDYADAIISSKYDGNVFLLRKEDAFSLSENMPNIEIYEIPNYLSSIDEMEEMLIDGEISLEDLKKIG